MTCFPFGHEVSYPVNIKQLDIAPDRWIIWTIEPSGVKKAMNYLTSVPNIRSRQTISIMPQGLKEKPKSWEEIKNGKFWIINGQHSVKASKNLQKTDLDQDRKVAIQTWNAWIVWTLDSNLTVLISEFYNLANHLTAFKPSWGQKILAGRNVWRDFGKPTSPEDEHYKVSKNQLGPT